VYYLHWKAVILILIKNSRHFMVNFIIIRSSLEMNVYLSDLYWKWISRSRWNAYDITWPLW